MSRVLPILFNTDMVRAILEGRKTVTRRCVKADVSNRFDIDVDGSVICYIDQATGDRFAPEKLCRYQPGDILYIRETYCPNYFDTSIAVGCKCKSRHAYKADYCKESIGDIVPEPKWTPSIHMPKKAARIWLKVTDVRVERLQDITEEQAYREGAIKAHDDCYNRDYWYYKEGQNYLNGNVWTENARQCFLWGIWNGTLKKANYEKYHSNANPWVWVIEFERCEKPEN